MENLRTAFLLNYLEAGWTPIPLQNRSKKPLLPWKEFQKRKPTKEELAKWVSDWPDLNIGILTGAPSGLLVLDIDYNGQAALDFIDEHELPATPRTVTSRGYQLFFKNPSQPIKSRSSVFPGVDVKADGGIVTVPPSIHLSGHQYKWNLTPKDYELADLPEAMIKHLLTVKEGFKPVAPVIIKNGNRNAALTSIAGSLRRRGVDEEGMTGALLAINTAQGSPPLPDGEVKAIAASVARYPAGKPQNDCAPLAFDSCTMNFSPTRADILVKEKPPERSWVVRGLLPVGGLVALSASPKAGKTTLTYYLVKAVSQGNSFIGQPTKKVPVLILALEEHLLDVQSRLFALGLNISNVFVHVGPLKANQDTFSQLGEFVAKNLIGLIVIDCLTRFWDVENENDPVEVAREMAPLLNLARQSNAGIILIHHNTKMPSSEGRDIRGSGDILAAVDLGIVMKRRGDENKTQRTIQTFSRYSESPSDIVISLENGLYELIGDVDKVKLSDQKEKVLSALSATEYKTAKEVKESAELPGGTVRTVLEKLAKEETIERNGDGVKGNPYTYRKKIHCA